MDNTPQNETHPLFSTFQSLNGIEQISALFKSAKNDAIKDLSSFCISFLYRNGEISNEKMKKMIIEHLQNAYHSQNKQVRKSAELAQIGLDDAYKKVT
ncbi:MAG: hypothetical protein EZS28_048909 [Streblomastix strix]|uniref:Uncharacterized protein n=1 Tax=Streblomastix strix TaxID=222440 RepID=A0A5J4TB17_9EUKA|nr:MAG: hypothetical protein EZS28_048909 [Streblomastix strix]